MNVGHTSWEERAMQMDIRGCEVIQVIRLTVAQGEGTKNDVVRIAHRYYSLTGEPLAIYDPAPTKAEP